MIAVAVRRRRRLFFPLAQAAVRAWLVEAKVKGSLIHSLTDAAGMPLANCTTPANGNERAQVHAAAGRRSTCARLSRGRPRKRPKVLATDKGV